MQVVQDITLVHVEHIELPGCNPPLSSGVHLLWIPPIGAVREKKGEVKRHSFRVEIGDIMQSTSSSLKHQVMRLAVSEYTDLLQVHLKVYMF